MVSVISKQDRVPNDVSPTEMSVTSTSLAKTVRRTLKTFGYLEFGQVPRRIVATGRQKLIRAFPAVRQLYAFGIDGNEPYTALRQVPHADTPCEINGLSQGVFKFLNRELALGSPPNWMPAGEEKLWLYHLHSWNYATQLALRFKETGHGQYYSLFRKLVRQWIQDCPLGSSLAWDAYPTSLRITNWLRAFSLFGPQLEADPEFSQHLRKSLYIQSRYLRSNIELDLLNNHVLENARALLLAGLFFSGSKETDAWKRVGQNLLTQGLQKNFYDDGGHDELSPMYHAAMLCLYQESAIAIRDSGETLAKIWDDRIQEMRRWLGHLIHPDGQIALLNDAAMGVITTDAAEKDRCPDSETTPLVSLADSGYWIFQDRPCQHYMVFDCGSLGPDHNPAHGHCDALSFELSVHGKRMLVDSGVGTYHGDLAWRSFFRSTRAHNTIQVDGNEQSDYWHRFRFADRASPCQPIWKDQQPDLVYVAGSHDGFKRLPQPVMHRRWICWVARQFWVICDHVTGNGIRNVESFLHFHPEVQVMRMPEFDQAGQIVREGVQLNILPFGHTGLTSYFGSTSPLQGWYAPEFGLFQKNHVWCHYYDGSLPTWQGYILWPGESPLRLSHSSSSTHSDLIVKHAARSFKLHIDQEHVTLENLE